MLTHVGMVELHIKVEHGITYSNTKGNFISVWAPADILRTKILM